ncbi:MAG: sigma-70 family RNA polymerase sigma factor [Candidatus Omnitrophica bacterium]|nr:sigma-70 family RNA polymerase sigma factor [Candidatus Omnitrophota bacterium]
MNFEDLVKRIKPKLKGIAIKLDGKYTSFNDDDLYQEALFSLWEKYRENQIQDKTDSYILQGCFFFLKNYIRKAHTRLDKRCLSLEKNINEANGTLEDILPLENEGVLQFSRFNLLLQDIERCLTIREKEVMELYLKNFTTREIGGRLGISHVMVVKLFNRIKEKCAAFKEEIL